jgi:hypothetical protein
MVRSEVRLSFERQVISIFADLDRETIKGEREPVGYGNGGVMVIVEKGCE